MRVDFWSDTTWPIIGGVEVLAARFLLAMRDRGHEFTIFTGRLDDQGDLPDEDEFYGMPLFRLPFTPVLEERDLDGIFRLRTQVIEHKQAFKPNVVHMYHMGPSAFFHVSTINNEPAPTLITLHGPYTNEIVAPGTFRGDLFRRADWIAGCSESVVRETLETLPGLASRTSVIPNSIDLSGTNVVRPAPGNMTVLAVGRMFPQKGFDIALDAIALLRDRFPALRLVIAGDGPDRWSLQQHATALDLDDIVEFKGWVIPEQIPDLINQSAFVIMPSRWEPFGLVALQSMQQARAVVASNVDGLPEVVIDGETGVLVEPQPQPLADGIARLLLDPDEARRMGEAGRRRAEQTFSWEAHISAYDELYTRLAKEKR